MGGIPRSTGPCLHTGTGGWRLPQAVGMEVHRRPRARPACALPTHVVQPALGIGLEAMVHMQRMHSKVERRGGGQSGMEQRRGIAAAAGGDSESARHGSFVSRKRP